ncbi:MAG: SLATT domain-containing protein [Promethearchaeota archaeon]
MHRMVASYNTTLYNVLTFCSILIGSVTSSLSMLQTLLYPEQDVVLPIIITCTGVLTSVISAFIKFSQYEEVTTANKQAYVKYSNLENNIRRQLAIYRSDRIEPVKYFEWLETKFDDIVKSAPLLPDSAYENYNLLAIDKNLPIPNQYGCTITINKDVHEDNSDEIIINYSESITDDSNIESDDSENKKVKLGDDDDSDNYEVNRVKDGSAVVDNMLTYEMSRLQNN